MRRHQTICLSHSSTVCNSKLNITLTNFNIDNSHENKSFSVCFDDTVFDLRNFRIKQFEI